MFFEIGFNKFLYFKNKLILLNLAEDSMSQRHRRKSWKSTMRTKDDDYDYDRQGNKLKQGS